MLRRTALDAIVHDPESLGLCSRVARTVFGDLHYVGSAVRHSDEVVLFLHGFGSSWKIWTPLIRAAREKSLLSSQDVMLIDLPSFGRSENKLNHLRAEVIGAELRALALGLGYKRIHVVGHSMGGFLALDIGAHQPDIASVRVVAGSYFSLVRIVNRPFRHGLGAPLIALFYGAQYFLSKHPWATQFANTVYKRTRRNYAQLYEIRSDSFDHACQNGRNYDARQTWGSIQGQVYAIFGSKDKLVTRKDLEELREVLPDAKVHVVPKAGHSLLIERPVAVAEALFGDFN